MKYFIFYLITFVQITVASASIVLNPRYDLIGNQEDYWNRLIFSSQIDFQVKAFKFYTDFFAEDNLNFPDEYEWRTAQAKGYLQELYLEYSSDIFFLKLGRQASRWSDSWVLPSLDVWTARKYERLFIDPLSYQLTHSTGASMSISKNQWQLDLAVMTEVAEDTLPAILPQIRSEAESINPGARFKVDFRGLQNTFVIARALKKNIIGYGVNYAFGNWVPKFEIGYRENQQKSYLSERKDSEFLSLGADVFIGQLTLTPQFVLFNEDSDMDRNVQGMHYVSILYTMGNHEFQLQEFANTYYKDSFFSVQYTLTLKKMFSIGLLYQNYNGGIGTLSQLLQEKADGNLFGVRFQLFTDIL